MKRNCSACNIKIDINNYKKDRTVCKPCYVKKIKGKTKTQYLQTQLLLLTNNQKLKTLIITKTERLLSEFQIVGKAI